MWRQEAGTAMRVTNLQDPTLVRDVFNDVRLAPVWLVLRVALGWFWLQAGWHSLQGATWPADSVVASGASIVGDPRAIALTLLGVTLILGLLVGPGAFLGGCLLAGFWSGSGEFPTLQFAAVVVLILAWKTAGWIGLDRWILPLLGLPWRSGALFGRNRLDSARENERTSL
jgi:thiosulfate dehydrogenase (quinone) large subunit